MLGAEVRAEAEAAVIVKRAVGPAGLDLRREAERLLAAAHPGVVAILRSSGNEETWELQLAHGGRPIAALRAPAAEHVAGIVAAAASTVADLHAAGIVHGHLSADHILLGCAGRVRLCGFGPDDGGAARADDVAALGAVLARLLGDREEMEPVPDRRWRGAGAWSGWTRRSLLTIADQATADPPSRRPSARRLASAITAAVPAARVPGPGEDGAPPARAAAAHPDGGDPPDEAPLDPAGSRLPALLGAAACVLLLGAGAIEVVAPGRDRPAGSIATHASTSVPSCPAEAGPGPGCTTDVDVEGRIVTREGRRFEVGQDGDQVAVGDWRCSGEATAAVLRPRTGEVFVFHEWADDVAVDTTATTVVAGARDLIVGASSGGCPRLTVRRQDGSSVTVELDGSS